jgi:hypothetical protein
LNSQPTTAATRAVSDDVNVHVNGLQLDL